MAASCSASVGVGVSSVAAPAVAPAPAAAKCGVIARSFAASPLAHSVQMVPRQRAPFACAAATQPGGGRVTRDIYEYPDDKFVELFDDESRRFFYYNVTTGKSQWYKPKTFEVYLDADAKAEEAAVAEQVLAQVGKVNAVGARASRANVAAIGMSAR